MRIPLRHPLLGHGIILAALALSVGVTRAVYVEPRMREVRSLRADEQRLRTELQDVTQGLDAMKAWAEAHPGQDLLTFQTRRARPARDMVPAFLDSVGAIAGRYRVGTELIQPAGGLVDETVADAAGNPRTYRKADLRFRLTAGYRDLGEYLREIESMDQLAVVRSVSIKDDAPADPRLVADVTIWLYGTQQESP